MSDQEAGSLPEALMGLPGKYRWAVKTVSDPEAAPLKSQQPTPVEIASLIALPAPVLSLGLARQPGPESTLYQVTGTLVAFKAEADQDYHLVIQDAKGHSMIAEIPDPTILEPTCIFPDAIKASRAAFDAKFSKQVEALKMALPAVGAPLMVTKVNQPVVITGFAYFDEIHGQTGVAPNGIEIHPVLSIVFN